MNRQLTVQESRHKPARDIHLARVVRTGVTATWHAYGFTAVDNSVHAYHRGRIPCRWWPNGHQHRRAPAALGADSGVPEAHGLTGRYVLW
jgi:hypothetical protein